MGGDLYHQRRQFKDGQLLFLVNSSMDASTKGSVSLAGKSIVELDAMDGQIYSYPFEVKEGINLSFDLEPAGSLLLFVSEKALKGYPAPAAAAGQSKLAAQSPVQVTRLRENALNIDYGSMRLVAERPQLFNVKINGTEVKPIPGEWWLDRSFGVYDIARWVRNGTNEVEVRVIGSHKNLLGPHYRQEKGLASPWHWKNIKSRIPAADYQMLDYGLMEDFDLIQ